MIRKVITRVLGCRLENVLAAGVSAALLIFFSVTRMFHSFSFNMPDWVFFLLPVGILGLKSVLQLLLSPGTEESVDTAKFVAGFFAPFLVILRDWFPFLLLGACYYSLYGNLILRVNPHPADETLSRIDAFMVGNQPSFVLQPLVRFWLTDFFCLLYFSHVIFFPGVALYFYLKNQKRKFRRIMMGFLTIMLMGIVSYILVPAVGPATYFAHQYTRDVSGRTLIRTVNYIMEVGRVNNDCFPSLHVGIPLLLAFYMRDYCRKLFLPVLGYVSLMSFAVIYLRYHYLVDVLAAFVYAPTAYYLNDFLLRHWPGERAVERDHHPESTGKLAVTVDHAP